MSDNAGDVEVMEFYRGRDGRHLLGMRVAMMTRRDIRRQGREVNDDQTKKLLPPKTSSLNWTRIFRVRDESKFGSKPPVFFL